MHSSLTAWISRVPGGPPEPPGTTPPLEPLAPRLQSELQPGPDGPASVIVLRKSTVRAAIHLPRRVDDPIFFKIVSDDKKVTHVAKLKTPSDFQSVKGYIRQAHDFSLGRATKRD
jgi:hypothetical protein